MWSFKNNGGRAYPKLSMGPLLYQYAIAWALLFFKLLVDPEIQQHIYHLNIVQAEAFINHQLTQKELDVSFVDVTLHNFQCPPRLSHSISFPCFATVENS